MTCTLCGVPGGLRHSTLEGVWGTRWWRGAEKTRPSLSMRSLIHAVTRCLCFCKRLDCWIRCAGTEQTCAAMHMCPTQWCGCVSLCNEGRGESPFPIICSCVLFFISAEEVFLCSSSVWESSFLQQSDVSVDIWKCTSWILSTDQMLWNNYDGIRNRTCLYIYARCHACKPFFFPQLFWELLFTPTFWRFEMLHVDPVAGCRGMPANKTQCMWLLRMLVFSM